MAAAVVMASLTICSHLLKGKLLTQQHAASFVAFGEQREQHLHLLAALLHIAQVVDDQAVEPRQPLDQLRQPQVPLGDQKLLHQQAAGRQQNRSSPLNQLLPQRT